MKSSGIGGQAVIEGIMMRNKDKYAIAVRKPDNNIEVVVKESSLLTEKYKWLNYPIIRGIFNFVDSMVTGVSTISYSASFYDDPAEQKKTKADEIGKAVFKDKLESVLMAVTVIISVLLAVGLFMLLPYFVSRLLSKYIVSKFFLNFVEGIVRVLIFILYILAISRMNDIKRTFMYHGAEHKCINCIEHGARLTPENVKNSSRLHKRCGTSFLFFVMFISVIFFIFIRVENTVLQIVLRVLLIPVIAGVSYEIIKWAGRSDNVFVNALSKPGMWLQKLTTKEPDMDMIEVAISAVEAVFDWNAFLNEYHAESENMQADIEAAEAELALSSNLIMNQKEESRSIHPEELEQVIEQSESSQETAEFIEYNQEIFNAVYEESDGSGSTLHDNIYEDDLPENVAGSASGIVFEAENELPEGFEIIEDDDVYDNAFKSRDNLFSHNAADDNIADALKESAERAVSLVDDGMQDNELASEQADNKNDDLGEGFEFVEEIDETETYADDVPLFKQRKTDKR